MINRNLTQRRGDAEAQKKEFKVRTVDYNFYRASASLRLCVVILLFGATNVLAQLNSSSQQNLTGEPGTFAIRGAQIVTVSGETINNGTVVIANGRIAAVGANVQIPTGATAIDAAGARVYPGMIDAGTSMGLLEIPLGAPGTVDVAETGDVNPNAKAITSVNPHSTHVNVTRVNGVTTVLTMPRNSLVAGQAAVINLNGSTQGEMAVVPQFALVVDFPRVSTFGGFTPGVGPQTLDLTEATRRRDQQLENLRRLIRDAEAYGKAQDAFAADNRLPRPVIDLRLAALVPFARGEKPVIMLADRERDIRGAIRFADEMKLRVILMGGDEAYKVANDLKQRNIPVIITGIWSLPPGEDDAYDVIFENAAKLQQAGVRFCISSGDTGANVRDLPYQAGMASAFGLPAAEALKAVTLYPAQILGINNQYGSIETGKIANIVVADGDILEARTKIQHLFINGRKIPLTSRHTELFDRFKDRRLPGSTNN